MATANLLLDKRTESASKGHPIKIQIYHAGKQYLISTKIFATEGAFYLAMRNTTKSKSVMTLRNKIDEVKSKADAILDRMGGIFELESFRRMFYSRIAYQTKGSALFIDELYSHKMMELKNGKQYKHFNGFQSSLNSLLTFQPNLSLQQITVSFLKSYENWLLERNVKISTVFTYLRPLRTVFKKAIADGLMPNESFVFGRGKYVIGNSESARRALHTGDIKKFWEYRPLNEAQQRAKDMWFFSYFCNGIAPIDIAYLTRANLKNDHIIYQRKKTKRSKRNSKEVLIYLSQDLGEMLKRQGNPNPDPFLFPILKGEMEELIQFEKVEKWKSQQNKILRRIGKKLNLESPLCFYAARHSFADALGYAEVNVKTVADALGSETIQMALNYMGNQRLDKAKKLAVFTESFKNL